MAYARNEFELAQPQGDGSPLRAHYVAAERATRRQVPQLHVHCPEPLAYLWEWFLALSARRALPNPLAASEIAAWSELRGISLRINEVELIEQIDIVLLQVLKEQQGNRNAR